MGRFLAVQRTFHDAELLGIEPEPENGSAAGRDLYVRSGDHVEAVTLYPPGDYEELNSVQWGRVDLGDIGPHRLNGRADVERLTVHGVGSLSVEPKGHNGHNWTEVKIQSPDEDGYSWDSLTLTIHH
jgi:hypothetical protein